jgi:hypothetical protein
MVLGNRDTPATCTPDFIARTTPHGTLDKQEYLRVEGLYVDAIAALARTVEPDLLQVHDVEFWDTQSDRLANLGLTDALDDSHAPTEREPVAGPRLNNLARRCLRDVAWLELMVAPRLLVHFGHDMRLIVASSIPPAVPLDEIRSSGLFVYDSDAPLPTLDAWTKV